MTDKITFEAMWKECQRELGMRSHVYPNRVAERKMSQALADKQIAVMQAMADYFEPLYQAEINEAAAQKAATEPTLL